ncbi:Predicted phospholipase, patatin/cPLA2 family [Ruminococcus sp. YE71]|uniref:patatin-like phospholipase family protein n=1 Tax=unclassified Ruminococcus TaxID=2608920 RepID=UPI0008801AB3|nr:MULTISPECIES: patatin family protein [unclassified Ruminococcus]SDA10312.1 Predicted phospholipase, patatin/cPLA2 family [Ruminococcus sp. YE78]SFW10826.1 Predicted phospholipase, patatin/cPLA2 family [Ruminococcus sp. YE71]
MSKTVIVAEGGASRTAYSAGVMDALLEQGFVSDMFYGVSAGAAFGVSYCSGQQGRNRTLVTDYMPTPQYSGVKHLVRPDNRSFYNLDYVYSKVPNELLPFDFEAFAKYKGKCVAVMTDLETGEAVYPDIPRDDRTFTHLRATCALPLLFPPIEIDGRKYMDGGIADSIPFRHALSEGCDKLIVILTRERGFRKSPEPTLKFILKAFRAYPKFCHQMITRSERYNEDTAELEKLRQEGKAFIFYPKKELLCSRTESDPGKLLHLYDYGFRHGMWAKDSLAEFLSR